MMASTLVGEVARRPLTVPEHAAAMPSSEPTSSESGISGNRRSPVAGTRSLRSAAA